MLTGQTDWWTVTVKFKSADVCSKLATAWNDAQQRCIVLDKTVQVMTDVNSWTSYKQQSSWQHAYAGWQAGDMKFLLLTSWQPWLTESAWTHHDLWETRLSHLESHAGSVWPSVLKRTEMCGPHPLQYKPWMRLQHLCEPYLVYYSVA